MAISREALTGIVNTIASVLSPNLYPSGWKLRGIQLIRFTKQSSKSAL